MNWVITRWYAPSLGRFISEDTLLGTPTDPPSRHLYAYGAGEPIGRWDPDGRFWYTVRGGDTLGALAAEYLRGTSDWRWIFNANRRRINDPDQIQAGWCIWIPNLDPKHRRRNKCDWGRATTLNPPESYKIAAAKLGLDWRTVTLGRLLQVTDRETKRERRPSGWTSWLYAEGRAELEVVANAALACCDGRYIGKIAGVKYYAGNDKFPWGNAAATTVGGKVFVRSASLLDSDPITAHEYIQVLQGEVRGATLGVGYFWEQLLNGSGPSNRYEAIGYLWEGHIKMWGNDRLGSKYGDNQPWCYYGPLDSSWNYCP